MPPTDNQTTSSTDQTPEATRPEEQPSTEPDGYYDDSFNEDDELNLDFLDEEKSDPDNVPGDTKAP